MCRIPGEMGDSPSPCAVAGEAAGRHPGSGGGRREEEQDMAAFVQARPGGGRRLVGAALAGAAALVALGLAIVTLVGLLPSWNPFASTTVDRSQPAVLHALADQSQYRAAVGTYSVVVDVERDARWVPSFIRGERSVLTATGTVDATVDLGGLDASTVSVDDARDTVTVALPAAVLGDARLDLGDTRVVARDRGLLDRLGGVFADTPTSERSLQRLAEQRIASAASADDALLRRAEVNTRRLVESLLAPLGFERVTVTFAAP